MVSSDSQRKEEEYDKELRKEVDTLLATGDSTSHSEIVRTSSSSRSSLSNTNSPQQLHSANFPRSNSPTPDSGTEVQPKRCKILSLLTLILSSTLAAAIQPNAVLQNQTFVFALVPLHFGMLNGVIHHTDKDKIPDGGLKLEVGSGGAKEISSSGNMMEVLSNPEAIRLIFTSAAVVYLEILQGRYVQGEAWQALEIYIIPLFLLLYSFLNWGPPLGTKQVLIYSSATFLVGFSMIGFATPGLVPLLLPLIKLPLECMRWRSLKVILERDRRDSEVGRWCLWAGAISTIPVLYPMIFSTDLVGALEPGNGILHKFSNLITLFLYSLLFLISQLSLIVTLGFFSTALPVTFSYFPRNLFLLLWAGTTTGGWTQMTLILALSCGALLYTDDELYTLLPKYLGGLDDGKYEVLPTSSSFSSTSPIIPASRSPPPPYPPSTSTSTAKSPPNRMVYLTFVPLLIYLLRHPSTATSISAACQSYLPSSLESISPLCRAESRSQAGSSSVDLVFSYYDEPVDVFKQHIDTVRLSEFVGSRKSKVFVYNKGHTQTNADLRKKLSLAGIDRVIELENRGREGATYLQHIMRHYNATLTDLASSLNPSFPSLTPLGRAEIFADHTYFLQPHLAWSWIAQPRLDLVGPDTGFAHFGPLMRSDCGIDSRGVGDYPLVKEIYNIFVGEVCPASGQLTAWSAQFIVSKRRILANAYERYAAISSIVEAPDDHWIHNIWGPNGSGNMSNPASGHSLERAWPIIFGCSDPKMADECGDDVFDKERCQCLDY